MPMTRPGLGHFVALSLALHAVVLLAVRDHPPMRNWLAGPVIVRLVPVPESTRQNHPQGSAKATTATETKPAAARHTATAAEKLPAQPHPTGFPARLLAALKQIPDADALPEPEQRQAAETASRTAALEQQLLDSLHAALMPHFSYPLLARRRGWEGIVRVGVRIEANGNLTRLHLVEPSPYDVLNMAAINSLSRLARLPNAGDWLQGRHVDLVLPVEYRLLEG